MKINKIMIYCLFAITVLMICMLFMGFCDSFESIWQNIMCGCIVSIIMCIVNYHYEKKKTQAKIVNRVINYYYGLNSLYSLTSVFLLGKTKKVYNDKLNILKKIINDKEFDYEQYDYNCFINCKKIKNKFDEIALFSNGIELYNNLHNSIGIYEHKSQTIKETFNDCEKYILEDMKKVDNYMDDLKNLGIYKENWKDYKKKMMIGFFDEKGDAV